MINEAAFYKFEFVSEYSSVLGRLLHWNGIKIDEKKIRNK